MLALVSIPPPRPPVEDLDVPSYELAYGGIETFTQQQKSMHTLIHGIAVEYLIPQESFLSTNIR